ncbi:MAG: hypothetical protein FWC23_06885 [Chitinispirillia bacterium]|nr:hypothetical protein [Chitinispirillia bacterium]MCL2268894.1 hypothetical protein [Chitinispirillia bacterium]
MRWYVKLVRRNGKSIYIAYSYETNDSCDGLLRYEEPTKNIVIERLSDGADEFDTKGVFSHIHGLLRKNELTEKIRMICIG